MFKKIIKIFTDRKTKLDKIKARKIYFEFIDQCSLRMGINGTELLKDRCWYGYYKDGLTATQAVEKYDKLLKEETNLVSLK